MSWHVPVEGDREMANESMAVICSDDAYRDEVSGTATQCSQPDSNHSITVPSLENPLVPVGGPGNPLLTKTISLKNDGSLKALGDDSYEDSGVTATKAQAIENSSAKAGTGFKQEQDAKGVNSPPGEKGNLKKKTKDSKRYCGVTSFPPVRKKYLLWIFILALSGNKVVSAEDECRCAKHTYLKLNEEGTIQCSFSEPYGALGWLTEPPQTPYISIQNRQQTGAGYKAGDYEMTTNGSLTIKKVKWTDNHNHTLVYAPSDGGAPVYCVFQVTVHDIAGPYHPVVNGYVDEPALTLHINDHRGNVSCTVTRTNPPVELHFDYPTDVLSLHSSPPCITINADGTFNTSIWASFAVLYQSVGTVSLTCRSKGNSAEWFPSATSVFLVLHSSYPMVNGSPNMQIVVLNVSKEVTLTCSMSRNPMESSLEVKLAQPHSEIEVANSAPVFGNNSDGTHNVTITSKVRILSPGRQHFTIQCGVTGEATDTYREVTTVHLIIDKDDMYDILPTSEPRNYLPPWIIVALLALAIVIGILIGVICWKYCSRVRSTCTLSNPPPVTNGHVPQTETAL